MSRISAFKNKISKLEEKNNGLKTKIIFLEDRFTLKFITTLDKKIILLKQEGQCKQIDIDSLVDKLYIANKDLKYANENIVRLNADIKNAEDRKFKNRLKKLLFS